MLAKNTDTEIPTCPKGDYLISVTKHSEVLVRSHVWNPFQEVSVRTGLCIGREWSN